MRLIRDAGENDMLELDDLERAELLAILDQWLTWRDSLSGPESPLRATAVELASLLSP